MQVRDREEGRGSDYQHDQPCDTCPRVVDRAWTKAPPRRGEQQQWQQKRGETDELKRCRGDVRADRAGPVVCFGCARRVPRRIVWIEGSRNQTQRQQQSDCEEQDRQNLVTTTRSEERRVGKECRSRW